jgi:pimeloyl-ACP methyl ester carboxylesterase
MEKKKKRLLILIPLLVLLLTAAVTAVVGSIRQADARRNAVEYDWPGQLYTVGEGKMYAEIDGPEDAVPVVFVPGLADGAYSWCTYVPLIRDRYRTIVYDPMGIGESSDSSGDRSADAEIYDLHSLLESAGIKGKCIFVGHSRGGAVVRRYAELFPEDVQGVVLVDSTNEGMISDTFARISYQANKVGYQLLGLTNAVGFPRLLEDMGATLLDRGIDGSIESAMGAGYLKAINENCFRDSYIRTVAEQFGSVNGLLDKAAKSDPLTGIPAYVLYEVSTKDPDSPVDETLEMLGICIENVSRQFPDTESQIVYDAGHYIHFTMPDEVTAGIDWVAGQDKDS